MAVKYYCDGCDEELPKMRKNIRVRWSIIGTDTSERDLCEYCFKKFDPLNWKRPAKEAPKHN